MTPHIQTVHNSQVKQRRDQILVAAYGLMGTRGLEAVHARTVAAEVGVNHATVHYYFPRRSDLLNGVAEYALRILQEDRSRFQEGTIDPREKVVAELQLAEAYCKRGSRFVKVLASLYVASIEDPALRKKLKGIWSAWGDVVRAHLQLAKPAKASPFSDPELLMATLFGIGLSSHLLDGTNLPRERVSRVEESLFRAR